ncbi:MAG: leucine-rich repeat domain-containing protein [Clostridiales bacterium]|nr:leucine-rich repeat domain-containing protein [Clostridiales bacterium]
MNYVIKKNLIILCLSLLLFNFLITENVFADSDLVWINLYPEYTDIIWNGNIYVTIGSTGTIKYSYDSIVWEQVISGTYNKLYSIAWNGDMFIAVGENGTILKSKDGLSWDYQELNGDIDLYSVINNNDKFIILGSEIVDQNDWIKKDIVLTSKDNFIWDKIILDSMVLNNNSKIVFTNNHFIANGNNGSLLTSKDGINWSIIKLPTKDSLTGIAFSKDTIVVSSFYGNIFISHDIKHWKKTLDSNNFKNISSVNDIIYGNNIFITIGSNSSHLISHDGVEWVQESIPSNLKSGIWDDKQFIAVGDTGRITFSNDGLEWYSIYPGKKNLSLRNIITNGEKIFAFGYKVFLTSDDGLNWHENQHNFKDQFKNVVSHKNKFVALSTLNELFTSIDGMHWIKKEMPAKLKLYGITSTKNEIVGIGKSDNKTIVASSHNSTDWTIKEYPNYNHYLFQMIHWTGDEFLLSGYTGMTGTELFILDKKYSKITKVPKEKQTGIYALDISDKYAVGASAYGNGRISIATKNMYWTEIDMGTTFSIDDILYRNNQFIAVGEDKIILGVNNNNKTISETLKKINTINLKLGDIWDKKGDFQSPKNIIYLSNPILELHIRETINKLEGDIFKSDLESIKTLSISSSGLTNLEGIEYLTNLESLIIQFEEIEDITPLKDLTKLEKLILNSTKITNIEPLKNLVNLKELGVASSDISDISFLDKHYKLEELYIMNTNVEDTSVIDKLPNLKIIQID